MVKVFVKIFTFLLLLMCGGAYAVFPFPDPPELSSAVEQPSKFELSDNWKLSPAKDLDGNPAALSLPGYKDSTWYGIRRMPATVLEILRENNVYPNLYYGKNLVDEVPQDLYKQDWWYRTTFNVPPGHSTYLLQFPGINYRAEIWLNGHLVADGNQIVGMYNSHELNVTPWIKPTELNALAVKVTPERALEDINGVEMADSWYDWINWQYLGYQGPNKNPRNGDSFVADRNAGIWKPVYLRVADDVGFGPALVNTELPLPNTDSARLTVRTNLRNYSSRPVHGILRATITRRGKPNIRVEQPVVLSRARMSRSASGPTSSRS